MRQPKLRRAIVVRRAGVSLTRNNERPRRGPLLLHNWMLRIAALGSRRLPYRVRTLTRPRPVMSPADSLRRLLHLAPALTATPAPEPELLGTLNLGSISLPVHETTEPESTARLLHPLDIHDPTVASHLFWLTQKVLLGQVRFMSFQSIPNVSLALAGRLPPGSPWAVRTPARAHVLLAAEPALPARLAAPRRRRKRAEARPRAPRWWAPRVRRQSRRASRQAGPHPRARRH